jgi:ubiquinone/menaquinone biosynthesis C-methylase UbiE
MIKKIIKSILPPILTEFIIFLKNSNSNNGITYIKSDGTNPTKQDLEMYWDPEYAKILEEWGRDTTWNEIQFILAPCNGKVLDVACGTGPTIKILNKFPNLDIYGFDISDLLIQKAIDKGIPKEKLSVADATKTSYQNNEFDYSYSIGSLEHFTEEGIEAFIEETARYTKIGSFHMIPISQSAKNEGWMKSKQSFFNNSEEWWTTKFKKHYPKVYPIASKWQDNISYGYWFLCFKS